VISTPQKVGRGLDADEVQTVFSCQTAGEVVGIYPYSPRYSVSAARPI